jgi:hypothetical protein
MMPFDDTTHHEHHGTMAVCAHARGSGRTPTRCGGAWSRRNDHGRVICPVLS